ncbi:MAG: hypothetical protein JXB60_08025 [Candidatus Cloacimonetes bacterium]|nr:hypothetical protein [Candidatus Cloacimonadota bacterium]
MKDLDLDELKFLRKMMLWKKNDHPVEAVIHALILVIATVIVIIASYHTISNLNDPTIFLITIPSFLAAILLFWVYLMWQKRNREKTLIIKFLRDFIDKHEIPL